MTKQVNPPLFVVGLKAYIWGRRALRLAKIIEEISRDTSVCFCIVPQLVDIYLLAKETKVPIFASTMDPIKPGRGAGLHLPEALKEAGAVGVMINHCENRRTLSDIQKLIRRAHEVGLLALVCCDSPEIAAAAALLGADLVASEPPELIGTLSSVGRVMEGFVKNSVEAVKRINPKTTVLVGAGVSTPEDAAKIIRLGADGTGASRAVFEAEDPKTLLKQIARAVEDEWIRRGNP